MNIPKENIESIASYPKLEKIINNLKPLLSDFLHLKKNELHFTISDKAETLAFDPFEKKILIWTKWGKKFEKSNDRKLEVFLKMGLFHECSHFRDLKVEQDSKWRESMKETLTTISNKKIKISDKKFIPIWEQVHRLYNEIDDIIVNEEVKNYLSSGISEEEFQMIYKEFLFSYKDKNWNLILEWDIDYSKNSYSVSFADYLLRTAMVPDQKIILKKELQHVIFSPNISLFFDRTKKFLENKQNSFKDKESYKQLQPAYQKKINELQNFKLPIKFLNQINNLLKQNNHQTKNPINWNVFDIIKFFTLTKWVEHNHHLIIPPYLRYEIIQTIMEPVYEALLLVDIIENNGKLSESNSSKWKWWIDHENTNTNTKKKILDDINKDETKNKVENSNKNLSSILDNISDENKQILEDFFRKYSNDITDLVNFFEKQLITIAQQILEYTTEAKKWKLNTDRLTKEITKDPKNPNLKKPLYDITEMKESVEKDFKKMDFTFILDISWSMDMHKWANGALSIISFIFSQALMHLEKSIQNILQDPDYKIDLNFILYTDSIVFSTLWKKDFKKEPSKLKFEKTFSAMQNKSWWTHDKVWWEKVTAELQNFLTQNQDYVNEVKNAERKPVILQIADSDVSADWVKILTSTLQKQWFKEESFSIKRLILGKYEEIKDLSWGFWENKKLNWKEIKRQEFVWNKNEVLEKIKSLFENFIVEYSKK